MSSSDLVQADLSSVDQKAFISLLSKTSRTSQADIQGVWSTISTLLVRSSTVPGFLPSAHALVARGSTPPAETVQYLSGLSSVAHETATSLLCGSILGGQGSESDEFGDYSFFVGELDIAPGTEGGAQKVVGAMGLGSWLESSQIQIVKSKSAPLPASLDNIPAHQLLRAKTLVAQLSRHLGTLQDTFEFRVVTSGSGGLVLHFLVGKGDAGWQGLGGASTWSEE